MAKMEKLSIVFLHVPDKIKNISGDFNINPKIPLPVELPDSDKESPDLEKLSLEMILAGILRIISGGETDEIPLGWIDYYRHFVLTAKPEIYHELTVASIVKTQNGEFDMALEINAVLEGLFPLSPGVLLNKALILDSKADALEKNGHEAERENAEAMAAFEAALSTDPVLPDTLFNAGFFFMRRKDFARARDYFTLYIGTNELEEIPEDKMKQAQKILKLISSQGLDDESVKEAYDCINKGNNEEALKKIRGFIERHPKAQDGWFLLGWTLRKIGRYSDGLQSLKKAVELGGSNCDIQNEMAICLMELGDLKGARKELEKALRKHPENTKIISNLGVLAQKDGRNDEASAFFRTVLELDPDDPLANHFFQSRSF